VRGRRESPAASPATKGRGEKKTSFSEPGQAKGGAGCPRSRGRLVLQEEVGKGGCGLQAGKTRGNARPWPLLGKRNPSAVSRVVKFDRKKLFQQEEKGKGGRFQEVTEGKQQPGASVETWIILFKKKEEAACSIWVARGK